MAGGGGGGGGGSSYARVHIALARSQWEWLEEMASKHKLPSTSKAIRCCVNCVALGDAAATAADDGDNGIGGRGDGWDGSATAIETREVELSGEQLAWLEARRGVRREEGNEFERKLVSSCMAQEEYTVFGIVRCKTSIAKCEGAKEAVKNIGERYHHRQEEAVVVKENIDITPKECGCAGKK